MISTSTKLRRPRRQQNSPGAASCLFLSLSLEMFLISAEMATVPTVKMIKGFVDFPAESKPAKGLLLLGSGGGFVPMQSLGTKLGQVSATISKLTCHSKKEGLSNGDAISFKSAAASWRIG